jgi:hypothetical protein
MEVCSPKLFLEVRPQNYKTLSAVESLDTREEDFSF